MRSQDDIFYVPQNDFDSMGISYYCGPNNDPQGAQKFSYKFKFLNVDFSQICLDCAFYATFYPNDPTNPPVTLVSEDGKHVFRNGNNTEPLGLTSGYLKVKRASCDGCSILTAAACNSEGKLKINPKYNYIFNPKLTLLF